MTNPPATVSTTIDPAAMRDALEELAAKHEDIISRIGGLFDLLETMAESNAEMDGGRAYRMLAPHVEWLEQSVTQAVLAREKICTLSMPNPAFKAAPASSY